MQLRRAAKRSSDVAHLVACQRTTSTGAAPITCRPRPRLATSRHDQRRTPLVISNTHTHRKPDDKSSEPTEHRLESRRKAWPIATVLRRPPPVFIPEKCPERGAAQRDTEDRRGTRRASNAHLNGSHRTERVRLDRTGCTATHSQAVGPVCDQTPSRPSLGRFDARSDSCTGRYLKRVLGEETE